MRRLTSLLLLQIVAFWQERNRLPQQEEVERSRSSHGPVREIIRQLTFCIEKRLIFVQRRAQRSSFVMSFSSSLLISSSTFSPPLLSNTRFSAASALKLFESDEIFKNSHMILFCVLRRQQSRIKALAFTDSDASAYAFIDKAFAQLHDFPLHSLRYSKQVRDFDDQFALTGNVTHVAEVILNLNDHVETLFMYVTGLQHYSIVLSHSWLRRHGAIAHFENNTLSFSSPFCLQHCSLSPILIKVVFSFQEDFLTSEKSSSI